MLFEEATKVEFAGGRRLRNAAVIVTDSNGASRVVMTSSLGYFQFDNMVTGDKYTIRAVSRRYRFESREFDVNSSLIDLEFGWSGIGRLGLWIRFLGKER